MVLLVLASLSVAPLPDPDYVNAGFMMASTLEGHRNNLAAAFTNFLFLK